MDLLSGKTSDKDTNVITGLSVIQCLVESLDTCHSSFGFVTVAIELDFITNLNSSLLDGS